jgi:endoglucanase
MKFLTTLLITAFLSTSALAADVITLKRGLPTDIWLSWPTGQDLDDPKFSDVFPEYRLEYKGGEFLSAKKAGFDFVRLTIDPAVFLVNRRPEKTEKLLAGLKVAIAEIQAAGLKVDVDLHSMPRQGDDPGTFQIMASEALFKSYLDVVADVGRAIADLPPDQIVFEPMNEPTADCDWDIESGQKPKWPGMLQRMHKAARQAAPKLTLILSGGCWGGYNGLVALDPKIIPDQNIMWSIHNYEPFVFTHQGAVWTDGHERFLKGLRFPPDPSQQAEVMAAQRKAIMESELSAETKTALIETATKDLNAYFDPGWADERLKQPFIEVEAWARKHKIPSGRIILGEFGANREEYFTKARQKERAVFYKLIRTEAETRGYAWSTWSWSGGMGLTTTDKSRTFDPIMLRALGLN